MTPTLPDEEIDIFDLGWLLFAQWADNVESLAAKKHLWDALSLADRAEWQRRARPFRTIIIAKDERISALERERDEAREKVASWMTAHSFATGHGDTLDDLLSELSWQVREREQARLSGLAEAAAWHDKRAHETPDVFEREFHEVSRNAFLKALSPPPIASSGLVLVPREATEEMKRAAAGHGLAFPDEAGEIWSAMIAASSKGEE